MPAIDRTLGEVATTGHDEEQPAGIRKHEKSKKSKKIPAVRGTQDKITEVGHVFRPNEQEKEAGVFHLRYNTREDAYYQHGCITPTVKGWRNGTNVTVNVTRRAGRRNDMGMEWAYMTRYAGCETGSISWIFDFHDSGLVVDGVMVLTYSRTMPGGAVRYDMVSPDACWDSEGDGSCKQEQDPFKALSGVRTLILIAYLDGNSNEQSQTQLSYQEWGCHGNQEETDGGVDGDTCSSAEEDDVYSFQVVIQLKPQELVLCTCPSVTSNHDNSSSPSLRRNNLVRESISKDSNNNKKRGSKTKDAKDKPLQSKTSSGLRNHISLSSSSSGNFHSNSDNYLSEKSASFCRLNGSRLSLRSTAIAHQQNCDDQQETCVDGETAKTRKTSSQLQDSIRHGQSTQDQSESSPSVFNQSETLKNNKLKNSQTLKNSQSEGQLVVSDKLSQSESHQLVVVSDNNNPDLPQEQNVHHSSLPCQLADAKGKEENGSKNTLSVPPPVRKKKKKKSRKKKEHDLQGVSSPSTPPKLQNRKKQKRPQVQTKGKLSRSQSAPLNYGFVDDDNVVMKDILSSIAAFESSAGLHAATSTNNNSEQEKCETVQNIQNGTVLYGGQNTTTGGVWDNNVEQRRKQDGQSKKTEKSVLVSMDYAEEDGHNSRPAGRCTLF